MGDRYELTRRALVKAGVAAAGGLLLPLQAQVRVADAASAAVINPYTAVLPITFPIRKGEFGTISNNWHSNRVGRLYPGNHRTGKSRRAHDGVDVFPVSGASLPTVYPPFAGEVLEVCIYEGTTKVRGVASSGGPRQDYSSVVEGGVPRYGNYVWVRSTESASEGYQSLYCHLQDETIIRTLYKDLVDANANHSQLLVSLTDPVGVLGGTGNADGVSQLHVELHYPGSSVFTCTRCSPKQSKLTAINPYPSLVAAAKAL